MSFYTVKPEVEEGWLQKFGGNDKYLAQLLFNRDFKSEEEIEKFLQPSFDEHLHDPFLMHDMEKAVQKVLEIIKENKTIVIFSDYDCDGIPGAVVLHDFFQAIGFTNFFNYIPHRHFDGFGLTKKAVQEIKEKYSPSLIITIDCGTSDLEAADFAKELGIDLIITDHHEPKEKLPEAVAVVNPKVGDSYPFSGLCGSGVIFKLVRAILQKNRFDLSVGKEKWWLDMVGVATIADMVPLVDENRVLAFYGLKVLRKTRRPGLQKLLYKQRVNLNFLNEDDVGFTIGPRINAASRMDTPEDAFLLLSTTDEVEAAEKVSHLEKLNTNRKSLVAQMTKDINKRLKLKEELPEVFVLGDADWRPSLVGLSANKLAEEYNRPVFLWGKDGNGKIKGSCRSGGGVSVVKLMNKIPEAFSEFGGHHTAGGFTVRAEKIHHLSDLLCQSFLDLGEEAKTNETLEVDLEITADDLSYALLKAQKQCAPFGLSNPKPIYLVRKVIPQEVAVFGKTKEHTKIILATEGITKEAITFFKLPENFSVLPEVGKEVSLLAHLEESFFMGRKQIRLRVLDVV